MVSGDYKIEADGFSGAFEPIACNTFISESTFGLPIYNWKPQHEIYHDIQSWIRSNEVASKTSVLIGYSLGKAQRLLKAVEEVTGNIYVHGAIWNVHETLIQAGWKLPAVQRITPDMSKETFKSSVVIAPPSARMAARGCDGSPLIARVFAVAGCRYAATSDEEMPMRVLRLAIMPTGMDCLQAVKATGARKSIHHPWISISIQPLPE